MNYTAATDEAASGSSRVLRNPHLPLILFISALVLAYGFEVFSLNLTVDEDSTAPAGRLERAGWSVAEGRWGMALLTILIPSPIAPVVSNGIGIALSGVAWWVLARRYLSMPPWYAAFAAASAGTFPVLAFIFSFSTIAFAIGVGNLLLLGFFAGLASPSWWRRGLGLLAATASVAIYDTFLVAVAALALALVLKNPRFSTIGLAVGATVLCLGLSRGIAALVSLVAQVPPSTYTGAFFDVPGLIAAPRTRMISAVGDFWGVLSLSTERFALSSPWLAASVILALVLAIIALVRKEESLKPRIIRIAAVIALVALPVCVEAVASVVVLRSMFYLPILLLVLASVASQGVAGMGSRLRSATWYVGTALVVLTVVGNATITNRSFAIAATTYSLDQELAFAIGQEKDLLLDGDNEVDLPVVVSGLHSWPQGALTTTRETLGMSFFDLTPGRTTTFLRAHGVLVHPASASEIADAERELRQMPAYPEPGWIAVEDGVLLLNFELPSELNK